MKPLSRLTALRLAVVAIWLSPAFAAAPPDASAERVSVAPYLETFPVTAPGGSSGGWLPVDAFPQLTFDDPVVVEAEPGSNRLFVGGRQGTIHAMTNDLATTEKILVLDLSAVTQGYDDCGLLSMAFHPEFGQAGSPNRGYFYVGYQFSPSPVINGRRRPLSRTPGYNRVSRFTLPDGWFEGARDEAQVRASEMVLINQFDEHVWHSLGGMFFGADGFLYVGNGDEGAGQDSFNNAQRIDHGLFSGVLRIDVNNDPTKSHPIRRQPRNGGELPEGWPESFTANYSIPNDNPWVDPSSATLEEFWAIGLRNPYRMTYDRVDNRIWVGDIGQTSREEVNVIHRGGNYQWAYREGTLPSAKPRPERLLGVETPPLYEYDRSRGDGCVIGGYVYRGARFPELQGKYIFGDNTTNRVFTLSYDGTNPPVVAELTQLPFPPSYSGLTTFGVDQQGELYVCKLGAESKVFRLDRVGEPVPEPPALLSETGAFADLRALKPVPGLLPYEVNSSLWSDGAAKRRWLAVPNESDGGKISFSAKGAWKFPAGTVFVKHFELPVDESDPTAIRRLETRFLVRDREGGVYGVTYRWRADGSDAELLTDSAEEEIEIKTAAGVRRQTWYYPSRTDCLTCHNAGAGHVLGVNARQLNRGGAYPNGGVAENQLRAMNRLGLFDPALHEEELAKLARLVAVNDETATLEHRIRSYLDANCSHCHRPEGARAYFDARYDTPLLRQGILNGQISNSLEMLDAKVIAPRDSSRSVMHARLASTGAIKMPSLARNVVDLDATAALRSWIESLAPDTGTRRVDRIAVLANNDVTLERRGQTAVVRYLSERAQEIVSGGALGLDERQTLQEMLDDPEAFVIAHVVLSEILDGIAAPTGLELNGLVVAIDRRGTVSIDPAQAPRLAEYWEQRRRATNE